jgi:hypothetical protein
MGGVVAAAQTNNNQRRPQHMASPLPTCVVVILAALLALCGAPSAAAAATPLDPKLKSHTIVSLRDALPTPEVRAIHTMRTTLGAEFTCGRPVPDPAAPVRAPMQPWTLEAANAELALLLAHECAERSLGYWSFRLCAGQSVKQFHDAVVIDVGTFEERQDSEAARNALPMTAVQRFSHGAACEDGARRSATVTYTCARDSGRLTAESVVEGPTCHYEIAASSSLLCSSHLFSSPSPQVDDIVCFQSAVRQPGAA